MASITTQDPNNTRVLPSACLTKMHRAPCLSQQSACEPHWSSSSFSSGPHSFLPRGISTRYPLNTDCSYSPFMSPKSYLLQKAFSDAYFSPLRDPGLSHQHAHPHHIITFLAPPPAATLHFLQDYLGIICPEASPS